MPVPEGGALIGRVVGRFRLVRLLGTGGMGSVYLAERTDGFRQIAAVKLLREGFQDAAMLSRFHAEQQALASLKHPGIVQLMDSGVTEDGIPYLVMDYIDGVPIDQFCDEQQLSFRRRIEMVIRVLNAVEHAHRRSFAHCDLKFSNILVTPDGKSHLLDFGLAQLPAPFSLSPEASVARNPFTIEFASPEQLKGQSLTTATDLYSVGVVLYMLLTGTHPFEAARSRSLATLRATLSDDVEPPSQRVKHLMQSDPAKALQVAAAQATNPAHLRRALRGDVDAILLKALRKEPEQRYGSASQFAQDLRNFLNARPVESRRGSRRYRAWKFIKRNRAAVTAAALLLATLLAGTAGIISQGIRAERSRRSAEARFDEARKLTNSLLENFYTSVRKLEGSGPAKQALVRWSRETLEKLARQSSANSAEKLELANSYLQLGKLQASGEGNPNQMAESLASFEGGLKLLEPIAKSEPANPQVLLGMARLLEARGQAEQALGKIQESAQDLARARALEEEAQKK